MQIPEGFVVIQGILVDVPALMRLKHYCDPMLCRNKRYCCAQYEITLDKDDLTRAVGFQHEAAAFAPEVGEGGYFEDPYEETDDGRWSLDCDDETDACAFSFRDKKGCGWCAIHAAALKHHLDPYQVKPKVCTMWPLALSEGNPVVLGIQDDVYMFPCTWKRGGRPRTLYPDIAENVEAAFGVEFRRELESAIAARP